MNEAARTIRDFGEQWLHYQDNEGYYASLELFAELLGPLLSPGDFKGQCVADIGSGTGRVVRMLAEAGAKHIVAVEPSRAMEVLRRNTGDLGDKVTYLEVEGADLPRSGALDFVVSLGVLHHIPDAEAVLSAAFGALKPGGRIVLWVYGKEGNELYLRLAMPLRRLTRKLPHGFLDALSGALVPCVMAYAFLSRFARLPLRTYLQNHLTKLPPKFIKLTIYDQLNPTYAQYYTREDITGLVARVGFHEVVAHHHHGYSWTVVGRKPGTTENLPR